jgi:putative ABC transport system permease protein
MVSSYLKSAYRSLLQQKGFAAINITSLTIGLIGCLTIGIFVWDELQFDKSVPGGENIYRIYEERTDNGSTTKIACVPPAFASFIQRQYPEIDTTLRILMTGDRYLLEVGELKAYEIKGFFAEASFFNIFPATFINGDAATSLSAPNAIALSKELAEKYFGKENPIGKTIKVDKSDYAVKGVFEKYPEHFHLDINYLMPLPLSDIPKERMEAWTWHQFYTYVKLKPGADIRQLEHKFQSHVKNNFHPASAQSGASYLPFFQQLKDIHLQSADFIYDKAIRGNETYVKGLTIIALFVLLIACFNFINLATARSLSRAKEIGVRKVIGAERGQLIQQFLSETVILALLSAAIATIITMLIIPSLNAFTDKAISFNPITHPGLALLILAAAVILGILAGIYPAMVLSGFQPVKVLKSIKVPNAVSGSGMLRKALVVVQFAISALLIVSATVVYRQINYLNNKDLGFDNGQLIFFHLRDSIANNPGTLETFKAELKRSPNILNVTAGYGLPGDQYAGDAVTVPGKNGGKEYSVNLFIGDYDYINTLGLRLIAGRDFSREMSTDVQQGFIINETAVKDFGFETPEKAIGQQLHWNEWEPVDTLNKIKKGTVIGVIEDFHYKSLHEKVNASVIQIYPQVNFKAAVKLKNADIKNTIAYINSTWQKFSPGYPLDFTFMDETYGKLYAAEEKLGTLLWIFTLMAIVVGCMGLFALAALSAGQRTKEIGIRKVLGASVFSIIALLSKNFLLLVAIAALIAFPVAWWTMNNWLNDFPYRISFSWWIFPVAGLLALIIALATICFQAIKAAMANPVKSLRTE